MKYWEHEFEKRGKDLDGHEGSEEASGDLSGERPGEAYEDLYMSSYNAHMANTVNIETWSLK
jgi:hypothetical protein